MKEWQKSVVMILLVSLSSAVAMASGDGPLLDEAHARAVRALKLPKCEGKARGTSHSNTDVWLGAVYDADEERLERLLGLADIQERADVRRRILTNAVDVGCVRIVRQLILRLPAGDASKQVVKNALSVACCSGKVHSAELLLATGVCDTTVLDGGLLDAVKLRSKPTSKEFDDGVSRDTREKLVALLLAAGADPNYKPRSSSSYYSYGNPPAHSVLYEAIEGRCPGVVRQLLVDDRLQCSDLEPLGCATKMRQESEATRCCENEVEDCCDGCCCFFKCRCTGNDFDPPCYFCSSSSSPCYEYSGCGCPCSAFLHTFCYACVGRRLRISDDRKIERMLFDYYTERTDMTSTHAGTVGSGESEDAGCCCGICRWLSCGSSCARVQHRAEPDKCAICLEKLDDDGVAVAVADCGHRFHTRCLTQSVRDVGRSCPLCRQNVCPPPIQSRAGLACDTEMGKPMA